MMFMLQKIITGQYQYFSVWIQKVIIVDTSSYFVDYYSMIS